MSRGRSHTRRRNAVWLWVQKRLGCNARCHHRCDRLRWRRVRCTNGCPDCLLHRVHMRMRIRYSRSIDRLAMARVRSLLMRRRHTDTRGRGRMIHALHVAAIGTTSAGRVGRLSAEVATARCIGRRMDQRARDLFPKSRSQVMNVRMRNLLAVDTHQRARAHAAQDRVSGRAGRRRVDHRIGSAGASRRSQARMIAMGETRGGRDDQVPSTLRKICRQKRLKTTRCRLTLSTTIGKSRGS